jgi:hypothetical protein
MVNASSFSTTGTGSGAGAQATGGLAELRAASGTINLTGAASTLASSMNSIVDASATIGSSQPFTYAGSGGTATGGTASISVRESGAILGNPTGSSSTASAIVVTADATDNAGGGSSRALGGEAIVSLGSEDETLVPRLTASTLEVRAVGSALGTTPGTATGGSAFLDLEPGQITVTGLLSLIADGISSAGNAGTLAGVVGGELSGGSIDAGSLLLQAKGAAAGSSFGSSFGNGGTAVNIAGNATFDVAGDLFISLFNGASFTVGGTLDFRVGGWSLPVTSTW